MTTAVKAALGAAAAVLALVVAAVTTLAGLAGGTPGNAAAAVLPPSRAALADIPTRLLTLYQQAAATCPGLPWTILAAIGKVETDHARNSHMVSTAGAIGPMQFEPTTFTAYAIPVPPGGVTPPTPWDPVDAVYAAARLLCANGARDGRNLPLAVWSYNHDPDYVAHVLHIAATYSQPAPNISVSCRTFQSAFQSGSDHFSSAALTAVRFACGQLGKPYVWGGNGEPGFDCSGLTQAAYAAAGIRLPRTAQDQYDAGPLLPVGTPLLPGDLVFFGTPTHIHHVGIVFSDGWIIDAPRPGRLVRIESLRDFPDFAGASRPAA